MENSYSDLDLKYTEIAILMTTCNKYTPGKQSFYLQSMVPLKDKSTNVSSSPSDSSKLTNQDSDIGLGDIKSSSVIMLDMPKDVARWFPTKWIPPGTRFIVSFSGGNITKPQIIGRDF